MPQSSGCGTCNLCRARKLRAEIKSQLFVLPFLIAKSEPLYRDLIAGTCENALAKVSAVQSVEPPAREQLS
jgi:hypothetical protein